MNARFTPGTRVCARIYFALNCQVETFSFYEVFDAVNAVGQGLRMPERCCEWLKSLLASRWHRNARPRSRPVVSGRASGWAYLQIYSLPQAAASEVQTLLGGPPEHAGLFEA